MSAPRRQQQEELLSQVQEKIDLKSLIGQKVLETLYRGQALDEDSENEIDDDLDHVGLSGITDVLRRKIIQGSNQGTIKKRAWKCRHRGKAHYSKGLCMKCYQAYYYQRKKISKNDGIKETN